MTVKQLKRQNSQDTRTHVVGELYDTERSYVESLQVLIEKYMKPLKSSDSNKSLIDSNLVDEIFYSIPEILQHHETFLSALQAQLSSDWDSSQVIGNVFIEAFTNQQIIDTYTAFINNWKNARHAIKVAIQAKPALERFLEACSREHRNKLTLDALLIMPVQRIPRYELLIKELIKHTPEDHPDHGPLMVAQREIHELALKIDRAEREMIHQEQLRDLEALIEGHAELQHPKRDFIRYDLVTISAGSSLAISQRKERVLFLFCDLLIMTSVKKKVSRRANLQAAFANSTNDLSLLEGNKFKLILRVALDQVELRHDSHQSQADQSQFRHHQQLQQQSYEQHLQALEVQRKKLIQDKRRELERDLYALQQMELLANQITHANETVATLVDNLGTLSEQIRLKLTSLDQQQERGDIEEPSAATPPQLIPVQHSAQVVKDLYLVQGPITASATTTSDTVVPSSQQQQQQPEPPSSQAQTTTTPSKDHQTSISQDQEQSSSSGAGGKHPAEISLEFIINNSSSSSGSGGVPGLNESLNESKQASGEQSLAPAGADSSQTTNNNSANCESLVVTFATHDRRQAFLQAFLDAKQQRVQQQQQQQQKMFSSSLSLRLAHPDSQTLMKSRSIASDLRRNRLQHQDEVFDITPGGGGVSGSGSNVIARHRDRYQENRNSPASAMSYGAGTIKHQMSAPLSVAGGASTGTTSTLTSTTAAAAADKTWSNPLPVALTAANKLGQPHCASCSPSDSCVLELHGDQQCADHHHHHQHHHHYDQHQQQQHHHHQLMHQPASHPALLHTICCSNEHNAAESGGTTAHSKSTKSLDNSSKALEAARVRVTASSSALLAHSGTYGHQSLCQSPCGGGGGVGKSQSIVSMAQCNLDSCQHHLVLGDQIMQLKFVPRFLAAMPMTFLNTQHPALHFAGSVADKFLDSGRHRDSTPPSTKCQTVRDDKQQLWLCMSNGYVSHVALIKFERQPPSSGNEGRHSYTIVPVVQSGGDICRSQINCATQVAWPRDAIGKLAFDGEHVAARRARSRGPTMTRADKSGDGEKPPPEVLIKSASPPVNIGERRHGRCVDSKCQATKVSSSVPSASSLDSRFAERKLSSSFTQLTVDDHRGLASARNDSTGPSSQTSNDSLASNRRVNPQQQQPPVNKRSVYTRHHHQHYQSYDQLRCRNHQSRSIVSQAPQACLHSGVSCRAAHNHCRGCFARVTPTISHHRVPNRQPQQQQAYHQHHQHIHHHHSHSHWGHTNTGSTGDRSHHQPLHHHNHLLNHHHHHHHHHHHNNNQHHSHHHNQTYHARHHTVPLAELRRALERQNRISGGDKDQLSLPDSSYRRRHLAPPANTPTCRLGSSGDAASSQDSIEAPASPSTCDNTGAVEKAHSTTPPPPPRHRLASPGPKSFRSAKTLRHQASLKTSSILAKLVSSAGRGSSYLKRSSHQLGRARSNSGRLVVTSTEQDQMDNEEAGAGKQHAQQPEGQQPDNLSIVDINPAILSQTTTTTTTTTTVGATLGANHALVSPLSSVSSLNSTNSSITMNSACASSPNRGSCAMLHNQPHWVSTTCCTAVPSGASSRQHRAAFDFDRQDSVGSSREDLQGEHDCTLRSRSATVPCRSFCEQTIPVNYANVQEVAAASLANCGAIERQQEQPQQAYKVSGILEDAREDSSGSAREENYAPPSDHHDHPECSSLWLGCDDGSLMIIDCLATSSACEHKQPAEQLTGCQNVHSELKLRAPISDIKNFRDKIVFVALTDGRLVVFKRGRDAEGRLREWELTKPQMLTVTASELNLTSRLCLVDANHLWYSYGRNIFVLNIESLQLETTIMTPTNDKSIQFTMQTITIDTMKLVSQLDGVWLSFRGNPLLQFYDTRNYKLLLEMSLLDSVNKVLSCGNEILRLHKTACLGATSLLSIFNESEDSNSLFVGTSAGIIIYLTLSRGELRDHVASDKSVWSPQVISLRHGHSGQVRFLRLVELGAPTDLEATGVGAGGGESTCKRDLCLVSGGPGLDLYGPTSGDSAGQQLLSEQQQQQQQPNGDDDSLNHLILWEL